VTVWVGDGKAGSVGERLAVGELVGAAVGVAVGGILVSVASGTAEASRLSVAVLVGNEVGCEVGAADRAVGSAGPQPAANISKPASRTRKRIRCLRTMRSTSAF
jgi:hypothetical protein